MNEYHIWQQELQLKVLTMIDLTYIIPDMKTNTDERTEERKNRFNGESILLTKEEARRHDCIFLAEIMATLDDKTKGEGASKHWDIMRKHLNWFRQHNAEAYMVLLD
jgi:hypothetical protein